MVGWHHRLNGQEFEQAPGDDEGQGSLVCCSPWGRKELDTTEQLNNSTHVCTRLTCANVCAFLNLSQLQLLPGPSLMLYPF